MRLIVNGKTECVEGVSTVAELLRYFELAPKQVAVEVNEELAPRSTYGEAPLKDGDTVEIVTFVGGG